MKRWQIDIYFKINQLQNRYKEIAEKVLKVQKKLFIILQ